MKIILIMPDADIHALRIGNFTRSFREAPLTLTALAALVPESLDAEISIVDCSVETLKTDTYKDYDIAAISIMTGTAIRGYEIAAMFRAMKIYTVIGGVHATILPDEAAEHCDTLITGYAEITWPRFLLDYQNNKHLKHYHQNYTSSTMENLPIPKRILQKPFAYMMPYTVAATRGCSNNCTFCTVPVINHGQKRRPIDDIINEVTQINYPRFAFNDVNLTENPEYAKELFRRLAPLKKSWGGLSTFRVFKDPEMIKLLTKSGCRYLLVGMESISQKSLKSINKGFNTAEEYQEGMKIFRNAGIIIQGCFVFGLDDDDESVFDMTVDHVNKLKIDIPRYAIATPYPGTGLHRQLEKEGRILTRDWSLYDTRHVVFRPGKMTPQQLFEGFHKAWRDTFKVSSILNRTFHASLNSPIALTGNLAYRIYINRMKKLKMDLPEYNHLIEAVNENHIYLSGSR